MSLTVKKLKQILEEVDEDLEVGTENVQDGINRHNDIVGFEDDPSDEYFILKIDNEAKKEIEYLADDVIDHLDSMASLTEREEALLNHACKAKGLECNY